MRNTYHSNIVPISDYQGNVSLGRVVYLLGRRVLWQGFCDWAVAREECQVGNVVGCHLSHVATVHAPFKKKEIVRRAF